jgi:hypothetical protein
MRFMGAEGCFSGLVYGRLSHHPHNLQAYPTPAQEFCTERIGVTVVAAGHDLVGRSLLIAPLSSSSVCFGLISAGRACALHAA